MIPKSTSNTWCLPNNTRDIHTNIAHKLITPFVAASAKTLSAKKYANMAALVAWPDGNA